MKKAIVSALLLACLTPLCARAENTDSDGGTFVKALNKDNIASFIQQTKNISEGKSEIFTPDDTAAYFKKHLAPEGKFHSATTYELPGAPKREVNMDYSRDDFIANVLSGETLMQDYESDTDIKKLEIARDGRSATLHTVSTEKGKLPWPDENGKQQTLPVSGKSECDEKLSVSLTNYIQMTGADCVTSIKFSPFEGKPLGD